MTDVQSETFAADGLVAAFAARELELRESSTFPEVDGPLSAVTFVTPAEPGQPFVTIVVTSQGELASLDSATEAVLAVHPDLVAQPAVSVESFDAASAELPGPGTADSFEITSAGLPIGIAIVRADRRHPDAAPVESTEPDSQGSSGSATSGSANRDLSLLGEVKLDVAVELGRQSVTLAHMLGLSVGAVVELDRAAGAPVDIRVNGLLYGHGEVVVVDDQYAVRIIEILENPGV